jgi:arabinofuranan 3-O-arabinosyltransferase
VRVLQTEDRIFTKRRLSLYGYSLLTGYIITCIVRFSNSKWITSKAGHPVYIDFLVWWVGSKLRNAANVYNDHSFSAAQISITHSTSIWYYTWLYPPTMLLLVVPLAWFPYNVAYFIWVTATACLYAVAICLVLPDLLTVILIFLPWPAVENFFIGQTAFIVTGLLGLALNSMEQNPYLSGACLGVLTYKPQFLLFFPLALVITGQWRVIISATITAVLFAGAASLTFGANSWLLFFRSVQHDHDPATLLPVNLYTVNHTIFGMMHLVGCSITTSWIVHITVALSITIVVCYIWWQRSVHYSLRAAAFAIGALIVTPYLIAYDLTALAIPAAYIVQDALIDGFLPGERFTLLGCFSLLYFSWESAAVGPIVLCTLMVLVVRRVCEAVGFPVL